MDSPSDEPLINQCPECSQDLNVSEFAPFSKIVCPNCEGAVRVRTRMGQYEIKHMLGEGGMSQVFAADDLTLGRKVALKVLHQSLSQDEKLTSMFEREAKLTASINHPNVVKVYTVGSERGYFYIAMELVDAVSVEELINEKGALPEEQVLGIAYDVVSGLKAAYQENLIHRDIKPGNMLVTRDGTAKLVDFGLAVAQGGADENEDIWATPFYVPPEKLVREPDTHLGDIYALGATCYHALAGQPPFAANTSSLEELIEIKSAGVDLKSVAPNASKATIKLIEQMMSHSAKARPSSYDILLEKIMACQGKATTVPHQHSAKSKGKKNLLIGGVAVGLIAAAALFVQSKKNQGANDLDSLLVVSGDRVISAAEREAAQKMLAGRNAMVRGQLREALRIFEDLEGNANFTQPTQGWNTFNRGLVDLLIGNEPAAREIFAKLNQQTGFEDKALKPYQKFFNEIGKVLSSPLPVLKSDLSPKPDSFESIGLLAAGLKNWEQNQFQEAQKFFVDFTNVKSPASDPWIGEMKTVVKSYLADFEAFQKMPNPSRKMKKEQLVKVKSNLTTSQKLLKTRSSLKKLVKARIDRAEEFITLADRPVAPPKKTTPPSSGEWTEAEKAELTQLQNLVDSFSDYQTTYLFTGAVSKLEAVETKTPRGTALRQDLIEGYRAADQFFTGLVTRFNSKGYSGMIRRKTGSPLDAKVTAADPDAFTIDLGFGPNRVEIEKFDPKWLVEAAEATLGAPSQENSAGWKEAFWFANACGLPQEATRIAIRIVRVDESFREAGRRFSKIKF